MIAGIQSHCCFAPVMSAPKDAEHDFYYECTECKRGCFSFRTDSEFKPKEKEPLDERTYRTHVEKSDPRKSRSDKLSVPMEKDQGVVEKPIQAEQGIGQEATRPLPEFTGTGELKTGEADGILKSPTE